MPERGPGRGAPQRPAVLVEWSPLPVCVEAKVDKGIHSPGGMDKPTKRSCLAQRGESLSRARSHHRPRSQAEPLKRAEQPGRERERFVETNTYGRV